MLKYAIVDDDKLCREMTAEFINIAFKTKKCSVIGKIFESAKEFLEARKTEKFDILFTDMMMPKMSGIELTQKLRDDNDNIHIIFMTSDLNYSVQSYKFNVIGFIRKDEFLKDACMAIDNVLNNIENRNISIIASTVSNTRPAIYKLRKIDDIVYIKTGDHCIMIRSVYSKELLKIRKSLSYCKQLVQLRNFLQINEGQIINPKYIVKIENNDVYLLIGGEEYSFPVSRRRLKFVEEAFLKYCEGLV